MPKLPAQDLIQAVISAISDSGGTAVSVSPISKQPRHFLIQYQQNTFDLAVYIWTLTHGGGAARPKDEYRIQLTGVKPPLSSNPTGGPAILIGYEPNLQCFAGFDLSKHRRFSPNSPSIQVPITVLHQALQDGISFTRKSNEEIAIGFHPNQFLTYVLNAEILHARGADAKTVDLLMRATKLQPIQLKELVRITQDRRRIINTVSRLVRLSSFRMKVTVAYDHRCAVTRMQLKLVDAAHILPVGAKGSNDEVNNGVCLSPTYHRAYDRGLIYLDETLNMRINSERERELREIGRSAGIEEFKSYLNQRIHLPADKRQWPDIEMIRRANTLRNIEL